MMEVIIGIQLVVIILLSIQQVVYFRQNKRK